MSHDYSKPFDCEAAKRDAAFAIQNGGKPWRDPVCPRSPNSAERLAWQSWPTVMQGDLPLRMVPEYLEAYSVAGRRGAVPSLQDLNSMAFRVRGGADELPSRRFGPPGPMAIIEYVGVNNWNAGRTPKYSIDLEAFGKTVGWGLSESAEIIGVALRSIAKIVSFIPGIGQGVAAVLAGVGSLAMGQPLDEALLDAAANAIPGGGIAKDAFKAASKAASALFDGKDVGEAVLAAARQAVESQGGPLAAAAFDAGFALVTGRKLQEAGFATLHGFAKGAGFPEQGIEYAEKVARAAVSGRPVYAVLVTDLGNELFKSTAAPREQVDHVLRNIVESASLPDYLDMPSTALAEKFGVTEAAARAARQVVNADGTVNEELRAELLTPPGQRKLDRYGWGAFDKDKSVLSHIIEDRQRSLFQQAKKKLPKVEAQLRDHFAQLAAPKKEVMTDLVADLYARESSELRYKYMRLYPEIEKAAKTGFEMAQRSGGVADGRKLQTTGPKRRGYDIAMGLPAFVDAMKIREAIPGLERPGFDSGLTIKALLSFRPKKPQPLAGLPSIEALTKVEQPQASNPGFWKRLATLLFLLPP